MPSSPCCKLVCILALASALVPQASAAGCAVSSAPVRVALLELYTSEGCSSCPPADRWISGIAARGFSSDRVIPLALHVDYWDYIGWQDKFAKTVFSARQREQAALGRSSTVYTPQVTLNGQDFRGWANGAKFEEAIAAINRKAPRANIRLSLNPTSADTLEVNASAQVSKQENAVIYMALYENGLTTQVKAGENSGVLLHHDYVVREWFGPYLVDDKLAAPWRQKIALKPGWKAKDMGVVVFVQSRANGEVLQALATKLCG